MTEKWPRFLSTHRTINERAHPVLLYSREFVPASLKCSSTSFLVAALSFSRSSVTSFNSQVCLCWDVDVVFVWWSRCFGPQRPSHQSLRTIKHAVWRGGGEPEDCHWAQLHQTFYIFVPVLPPSSPGLWHIGLWGDQAGSEQPETATSKFQLLKWLEKFDANGLDLLKHAGFLKKKYI